MAETNPNDPQAQAAAQAQGARAAQAAQKEAERRRAAGAGNGGEEKSSGGNLRPDDFEPEVPMRQGPMPMQRDTPPTDAELFAEDDEEAAAEEAVRPRQAALAMKPRRGRPVAGAGPGDQGQPAVQIDPTALGLAIAAAHETIRVRTESTTATEGLDETAPGGCYVVDGKVVDAFNKEIKAEDVEKQKESLKKEHVAIHEHAQKTAHALRRRAAEGRR
jgi:hypothetical protein